MADWWKDLVTGNKARINSSNTVNNQLNDKMPRIVKVNMSSNFDSGKSGTHQQLSFTSKLVKTTPSPNKNLKLNSSVKSIVRNEDIKQVQKLASPTIKNDESVNDNKSRIKGPKIHCRLCDRDITGQACQLLYDYSENMETRLGRKINIILNSTCNYTYLSNYCCSSCTSKIQICFSLLVEIQASDEVIRQTYEHLSDGSVVNTSTQTFLCEECKTTITGIKKFIRHYESHILKKTIVGSRRDLKITDVNPIEPKENLNDGHVMEILDSDEEKNSDKVFISKPSPKAKPVIFKEEKPKKEVVSKEEKSLNHTPVQKSKSPVKTPTPTKAQTPIKKIIEISPRKPNSIVNDFIVNDNKNVDSDDTLTDVDHFGGDDLNSGREAEDDNLESDEDESVDLEKAIKENELRNTDFLDNEMKNFSQLNVQTDDELSGEVLTKSEKDAESDADSCDSDDSYQKLVNVVKNEIELSSSSEEEDEDDIDDFNDNMNDNVDMDDLDNDDNDEEDEETEAESNKGKFSCHECNSTFEYKFLLVHHFMKDHNWSRVFDDMIKTKMGDANIKEENDTVLKSCRYCKESFEVVVLKKHVPICKQKFFENREILCPDCGKMFTYKKWVNHRRHHEALPHPDGWPCDLCGQRFRAKRFLKSHLAKHDESKKKICEICGKKLLPLSLFSHMLKHREKKHICQYCGKGFTYQYSLRIHLRVHDTRSDEPDGKTLKRKQKLTCWFCKAEFIGVEALNEHLKESHNAEGSQEDSRFPCSKCEKRFADIFSLKAHLKLIHEIKDEEISNLKSLPIYRYIECNICNKVFNSENKVRVHLKKDHGLKPFEMEILKKECEKCGKKFASKQNLIHHINAAHLHIKPMSCDICQEKFAKHSSLIYHKLRHTGEKPFQCEFCLKSYRQRNDVIRHLARHVRDKELNLEEASAINNSPSPLVMKRRIFLKDSSINYQTVVRKSRSRPSKPPEVKTEVDTFQIVGEEEEPMIIEGETVLEGDQDQVIEYEQEDQDQIEFTAEQIQIETEPKMEYDDTVNEPLMYVEEIAEDDGTIIDESNVQYVTVEPVYNQEESTIILSSPDQFKSQLKDNTYKNVTYRLIPSQLKYMPAVIVKKQEQF